MTLRQYLIHLFEWLRMFPLPRHNDHLWIGVASGNEYECPFCKATWVDDNSDLKEELEEWDKLSDEALDLTETELQQ